MNVKSKLRTTCTIINRSPSSNPLDVDEYGNRDLIETQVQTRMFVRPIALSGDNPEVIDNADIMNSAFDVIMAPDEVIHGLDTVIWTDAFGVDHSAEVFGEPKRYEDLHGRPVYVGCVLKESII